MVLTRWLSRMSNLCFVIICVLFEQLLVFVDLSFLQVTMSVILFVTCWYGWYSSDLIFYVLLQSGRNGLWSAKAFAACTYSMHSLFLLVSKFGTLFMLLLPHKVCGCCLVTLLNLSSMCDWCVVRWGSWNKHHKDTSFKEIGLRLQISWTNPHSIVSTIRRIYVFS